MAMRKTPVASVNTASPGTAHQASPVAGTGCGGGFDGCGRGGAILAPGADGKPVTASSAPAGLAAGTYSYLGVSIALPPELMLTSGPLIQIPSGMMLIKLLPATRPMPLSPLMNTA